MPGMTIHQAFDLAVQHLQVGQLNEAESIYRKILTAEPRHAGALHHLGLIAHQTGRNDVAVELIRQAIFVHPGDPDAATYNNLGNVLRIMGNLEEAIAVYRQAITIQPGFSAAHYNLGIAMKEKGHVDESIAAYRQAITLQPAYPEAHCNLGVALYDKGRLDQAITEYRRAITLRPFYPEAHSNLGNALKDKGQLDDAIAACRQAITLRPAYAEAHNNLGSALKGKVLLDEAIAAYRQAITLQSDYPEAYNNLGAALFDKGQLEDAIAVYRHAISLKPNFPEAHGNLGIALSQEWQLDAAIAAYRQAVTLKPEYRDAHCSLVFYMNFHPDFDAQSIAEELRSWNRQHAEPLRHGILSHSNDRTPNRCLRIGYVSPNFRAHVIGYYMLPLLVHHNSHDFEVFCYAQVDRPDAITEHLRGCVSHWRNTENLTDEDLAAQVRSDQIDILVDLNLHMADQRLLVFARKPAPVQVTFAGYPGSTGLTTIDYRLSDPYLDPPGMDESIYSEKTVRVPRSLWCYDTFECSDLPVSVLPAQSNGFITFGCLNNLCKVNDSLLPLWAKVLRAVPSSRLLLLANESSRCQQIRERLRQEGIAIERIEFVAYQPRRKYLELYHRIDLCLDTLPYNGHHTSLDSLWMGVPVVTLVGQTIVGRAGLSQLMDLGFPEMITQTPEEYVRIAAGLATDLPRLAQLRSSLRARMEQSPLMDAPGFARDIEAAYRKMWRTWCDPVSQASNPNLTTSK